MADEPDNLVLELLRGLRAEIGGLRADIDDIRANMATKANLAEVRSEVRSDIKSLRADVASDLLVMQAKTDTEFRTVRDQIVGLRRAVVEYHSAVVGHGVLISELEARMRRVEQHLNLSASDAH